MVCGDSAKFSLTFAFKFFAFVGIDLRIFYFYF